MIFNSSYLKLLKSHPPPYYSLGTKHYTHSYQKGMLLVEVILAAVFLIITALGTIYFFTQTKTTMSSSSQVMECQVIVKQALEDVISLGTRLYGYKIKHSTSNLNYTPLFITKNTKGYDVDDNIKDVGDGSELAFPPQMYQELYKNVVGMDIDPPIKVSPQSNTGEPIISDVSTYPIEISTSVLFVNSANALQYLYNSDSAYSTGDGKLISTNNGLMSSMYQKYKERFGLDNIQFYVKITPLRDGVAITTRPILTRPRFPTNSNEIPLDLIIQGDENIGFEIKVKLKYELNGQNFNCEGMHKFRHQRTGESGDVKDLNVDLKALANGVGKDFLQDADLLNTSCDAHGNGYDDMTLELDFNTITSQQIGTVILCQMNSYCRSEGDDRGYGNSCSPEEEARWQRCHDIQPKPSSDQSWTLKSKLKSKQVLTLQFNDMKENRRYDLNIAEFAMDGEKLRTQKIIFYIDAKRPYIDSREFTNDNVGTPTDNIKGRFYNNVFTYWKKPADSDSHGKWLQCNTDPVDFKIIMDDQFTHNLKNCNITWTRKDGNGTTSPAPITSTLNAPNGTCRGTLSTIQHGRQTIIFQPKDTCEPGPWNTENLVWDTDLPNTFEAQDFTNNPEWLYSTSKDAYPIKTEIPAKTTAGKFPKHYSVDCYDNFQGYNFREDGDSDTLECRLSGSVPDHDDGCNPNLMGVKYYHVCGGTEVNCNHSKNKEWAVYVPLTENCLNVRCEPDLACCDASGGTCNGVNDKHCGDPITSHCTNPKGGKQSSADEILSGCPPLGLNNCTYRLPCEASNPFDPGERPTGPCNDIREGIPCDFTRTYRCQLQGSSTRGSAGDFPGRCEVSNYSCTIPDTCSDYLHTSDTETRTRCVTWLNGVCQLEEDYDVQVSCGHCNQWSATSADCPSVTFSGTCGVPSGSCSAKPVGGGNLSQEQCNKRDPICCDSNTTCCPGDSHPSNPNCPPICDSTVRCCPGDTPSTNPTHCIPQQPECVRLNGTACCPQTLGGTCTGRWCIQSGTQCNYWGKCHIKDPGDGICRPSCGHLINSGTEWNYKHHGLDCKIFSGDEPRGMQREKTCADLNVINYLGGNNWKRAPEVGGVGNHEEITIGGECCVRDIDLPMSVSDLRASCRDYWLCYRGAVNENINRNIPREEYYRRISDKCDHLLPER